MVVTAFSRLIYVKYIICFPGKLIKTFHLKRNSTIRQIFICRKLFRQVSFSFERKISIQECPAEKQLLRFAESRSGLVRGLTCPSARQCPGSSHPPGCRCGTQHSRNYRQTKMGGNEIPSEVTIYQDAFAHFDKTNSGAVSTKLLGSLLRFVGENPSDAEVQVSQELFKRQ